AVCRNNGAGLQFRGRRSARCCRPLFGAGGLMDYLVEVKDLHTYFYVVEGEARAVDGASFAIRRGQVLGVVGESGCGKSVTARSILNMVRPPGKIVAGEIIYHRTPEESINLAALPPMGREMRAIRGGEIAMIFQEPRASLSPVHS